MKGSDTDWLLQEMELVAERAAEQGIDPVEFVATIDAYSQQFKKVLNERAGNIDG